MKRRHHLSVILVLVMAFTLTFQVALADEATYSSQRIWKRFVTRSVTKLW